MTRIALSINTEENNSTLNSLYFEVSVMYQKERRIFLSKCSNNHHRYPFRKAVRARNLVSKKFGELLPNHLKSFSLIPLNKSSICIFSFAPSNKKSTTRSLIIFLLETPPKHPKVAIYPILKVQIELPGIFLSYYSPH